jgi:hypothetical protein
MKQLLTTLLLIGLLNASAQTNSQHSSKPIYIGKWNGSEKKFKSPYVVIINDSNLILIRKKLVKNKITRIDTALFTYQAKAIEKGYEFVLKAPKALINKDKSLVASFLISNPAAKPGQSKLGHPTAVLSVDFADGAEKPSSLNLVKE